jgi:hypothetical protein
MDYSVSIRCSGNACLASRYLAMDFTITVFRRHETRQKALISVCFIIREVSIKLILLCTASARQSAFCVQAHLHTVSASYCNLGRAIAQAVSQSLASHRYGPRFEPGLVMWDFFGGQSGAGAGFLRVPRFPLPIFIPPIAPKII